MMKIANTSRGLHELGSNPTRDIRLFMFTAVILAVIGNILQIAIGWYSVDSYVTTLLAFSYMDFGFIRRGLIGTVFQLICRVFPGILTDTGAFWFMWVCSFIYLVSLLLFCRWVLLKLQKQSAYKATFCCLLFFLTFLIPTAFFAGGAFGRADLIQMVVCLLQIYLISEQKAEWLTVPLTFVNVLFHEGYLCMTFAAVLIVILYRALKTQGKKSRYWGLFAANMVAMLIPAVYSVFISHVGTLQEYENAFEMASALNPGGYVHYNLLSMLSGYKDNVIATDDGFFTRAQLSELPYFLVTFLPILYLLGKLFVKLFKSAKDCKKGVYIWLLILGPMLVSVEFAIFCDFGRYVWWLFFYYFSAIAAFAAMGDIPVRQAITTTFNLGKRTPLLCLVLLYQPILMTSFGLIPHLLLTLISGHR